MSYTGTTSSSTLSYNGITLATGTGETPKPAPKELIATRAVESQNGWLGQIIMSGEIVYQTKPQETSQRALGKVNKRVHDRFRRLIAGA
jgi:hypothetical protein